MNKETALERSGESIIWETERPKKHWIKRLLCNHNYKLITMWAVEECEKCGENRYNMP